MGEGTRGLGSGFPEAGVLLGVGGLSITSLKPFARGVWHLTVTEQRSDGVQMTGRED